MRKKFIRTLYKFSISLFFPKHQSFVVFRNFSHYALSYIYKPDFCPPTTILLISRFSSFFMLRFFNHHIFFFGGSTIPLYTSSQFIFSKYSCSIKLSTVNLFTGFRRSNRIIISLIIGK